MLVTSLLAGTYVVLLRQGRRRTVLRPASRDHSHDYDVTVETATVTDGDWRYRKPEVDNDLARTTIDVDSSINTLFPYLSFPALLWSKLGTSKLKGTIVIA